MYGFGNSTYNCNFLFRFILAISRGHECISHTVVKCGKRTPTESVKTTAKINGTVK